MRAEDERMFARVSVAFSELDERSSSEGPLEGDIVLFCEFELEVRNESESRAWWC